MSIPAAHRPFFPPHISIAPSPLPQPAQATDEDLRQLAEFLAWEFSLDVLAAASAGPGWYREQVGPDICGAEQAVELKRLTIACCARKRIEKPLPGAWDRDVRRDGVRDAPGNRTRRAELMRKLPGRVLAGVRDLSAAVDAEFEAAMRDQERQGLEPGRPEIHAAPPAHGDSEGFEPWDEFLRRRERQQEEEARRMPPRRVVALSVVLTLLALFWYGVWEAGTKLAGVIR